MVGGGWVGGHGVVSWVGWMQRAKRQVGGHGVVSCVGWMQRAKRRNKMGEQAGRCAAASHDDKNNENKRE